MNIQDRAMLVSLTIKQWSATKHDKRASREVADTHNSDVTMGRYNKQLVCKTSLEGVKKIAGSARTEHYKRTLPWSEDGSRILSSAGYFDYAQVMRDLDSEWTSKVREFCNEYPSFVQNARTRLNGLFNENEYPSANAIFDKFAFGFNVLPLPTGQDFRVQLGDIETSRIRAEIQSTVDCTLNNAMSEVWDRVKNTIGHLLERLKAYNVGPDGVTNPFRDSLVENVRELVQLLPTLNLTNDWNLTSFTDQINSELLRYSPDTLRASDSARESIVKSAEDILAKMGDYI